MVRGAWFGALVVPLLFPVHVFSFMHMTSSGTLLISLTTPVFLVFFFFRRRGDSW